jgi:SAM-dependent methyltransferase
VGAGRGGFLNLVKAEGCETVAVELNPRAVEVCKERGHRVLPYLIDNLTAAEAGGYFDLVTSFQVVEHVSDPAAFVRHMARFVGPGGYLAIGVPFRGGIYALAPLVPHQWPPHHITRWRNQDLRRLGEVCGLEVVEQAIDPLRGQEISYFPRVNDAMAKILHRPRHPASANIARIIGKLYEIVGGDRLPIPFGGTTYALYRRPTINRISK